MTTDAVDPVNLPVAVNRRYRQARDCVRQGRHLLRGQADPVTRELVQALNARRSDHGTRQQDALGHLDRDLVRALEIHEAAYGLVRAQLQAYLLTDLTYEEVAVRVHESAQVVELYCQAFFDVRGEHLSDQARKAVVAAYQGVPPERLVTDYIWKLIGLTAGAQALDEAMTPAEVRTAQDAVAASAAEAKTIALHKIGEAIHAIKVNDSGSVRELRRVLESLKDVQPDDAYQRLLDLIGSLLNAFQFTVGSPDPETTPPEAMKYASSACELHYDEMIRVGLGQTLENEQELLAARFPDGPGGDVGSSMPQPPGKSPAAYGADAPAGAADPQSEPPKGNSSTRPRRVTPKVELQFKLDRIAKDKAAAEKRQADREEATRKAAEKAQKAAEKAQKAAALQPSEGEASDEPAENAAMLQELAREAECQRLDRAWEALAANTSGAVRNRRWRQFLREHPGYVPEEARTRLVSLEKRGKRQKQGKE